MNLPLQPIAKSERIGSLDFIRGIAVLGILIMNIQDFAYPNCWSPYQYGFHNPVDVQTRFWVFYLTQGKCFGMFAMLFGVGFYIFLERLQKKGAGLKAADIYARRLLWLFVIGIIHAYLIWNGDVLYHYAICGLLLFPFRSFKISSLWIVLAILFSMILLKAYQQADGIKEKEVAYQQVLKIAPNDRTEAEQEALESWEKRVSRHEPDTSVVPNPRPTYWENVVHNTERAAVQKGQLYFSGIIFRTLILMLLGVILYKSGIFQNYKVLRGYWLITFLLLGIALVISYVKYYGWTFEYQVPVMNMWKKWLFTIDIILTALGYVLFLNGVYQKYIVHIRFRLLSCAGRMALTIYLMQSVTCGVLFYGFGFDLFNQFSRTELLYIVVVIWMVQLVFSKLWLMKFKYGPVEWLWRKLTYAYFSPAQSESGDA